MKEDLGLLFLGLLLLLIILLLLRALGKMRQMQGMEDKLLPVEKQLVLIEKNLGNLETNIKGEFSRIRMESSQELRQTREENSNTIMNFQDSLLSRMAEIASLQKGQMELFAAQLAVLSRETENRLGDMRKTLEVKLKDLQDDNSSKLEKIRITVDEKLHATLERRLGESFQLVSDRLEMVHKGLGEMQNLAAGVSDLKKVLSNVKVRGIWGEVQLGNILEEILAPEQYAANVMVKKGSSERVDYAVKLPGKGSLGSEVWLPIDAKFPQEDYLRLVNALEEGDRPQAEEAGKQLENRIKAEARDISDKYLNPPHTTDFAIMFLPTEGLYAEVVRRPELLHLLQQNYRINVTGPTTMAALLNSLSVGFRTLAIEKRSSEVWDLLGAVKTEFGKFGDLLEKTKKKLDEASSSIDVASRKTRNIERKLKEVQKLPADESQRILGWGKIGKISDQEQFDQLNDR